MGASGWSLIRKEVCRQRGQVIRARLCIALPTRAVEFQRHDISAPGLRRGPRCDVVDRTIDRRGVGERHRRVEDVQRESELFAIEALCEHSVFGRRVEVWLEQGDGAQAVRRTLGWMALDGDDSRSVLVRDKQDARD